MIGAKANANKTPQEQDGINLQLTLFGLHVSMSRTQQAIALSTRRARGSNTFTNMDPYRQGVTHAKAGALSDAIVCFEKALQSPNTAEREANVLQQLGDAASQLGKTDLAIEFFHRALAADPYRVEAIVPLSTLYADQQRYVEAQSLLAEKIKICAKPAPLWLALGNVTREAGDLASAENFIREALSQRPASALALGALGDLLSDMGDEKGALAAYEKSIKKDPKLDRVRYHRGLLKLSLGQLREGWRDFEYRFTGTAKRIEYMHGLRRWHGNDVRGRTLLVTAEQGLGDQLIFASCFPDLISDVQSNDGSIAIECETRLVDLFARSFPDANIFPMSIQFTEGRHQIDYPWLTSIDNVKHHIPMGSLGQFFRSDMASMPDPLHYLFTDPIEQERWRSWLQSLGAKPRLGICWRSGNTSGARGLQFAPLKEWANFLGNLDVDLVSLQYDATAAEITEMSDLCGQTIAVPPSLDQKQEIDRTAALVSCLDMVVTAPTAVASLSAGCGIPTLKIVRDRSWTSFGRDFEPLTPSCKIIRGKTAGDWPGAFALARAEMNSILVF